jgi:hypothetical protein
MFLANLASVNAPTRRRVHAVKSFWRSTLIRLFAIEIAVIALGTMLVLAIVRVVNARGISAQLASLLRIP